MTYILWEFTINEAQQSDFERAYRPDGVWAELFRRDSAYKETILLRDHEHSGRYLTIDVWEDKSSYLAFKDRFAHDYHQIDQACEKLTSSERLIGIFESV